MLLVFKRGKYRYNYSSFENLVESSFFTKRNVLVLMYMCKEGSSGSANSELAKGDWDELVPF